MQTRILVVEDEETLRVSLADRLKSEGYEVLLAEDGQTAVTLALAETPDLMILDLMLPKKGGFDVCRDLRREGLETPILMLTARREVVDRVVGLKLGADDYLTKPFEMMELLARVEALLRRAPKVTGMAGGSASFGDIRVDLERCEVFRGGALVPLSALDFKLLKYFITHQGETLTRDQLLDEVWGYDATLYTRTVDVHVAGLRQKLEPKPEHPQFILTVHRVGYKFVG